MGDNSFGQLGVGTTTCHSQPTKLALSHVIKIASGHHSAALTSRGQLYFWGTGVFGSFYEPKLVVDSDIVDVSVGGCFGAAIDRDGLLWTWGSNANGELGLGDYEARPYPYPVTLLKNKPVTRVACGGSFAIALGLLKDNQKSISRDKSIS